MTVDIYQVVIFTRTEFFKNIGLANLSCPFKYKRFTVFTAFPFKQGFVYASFHFYSPSNYSNAKLLKHNDIRNKITFLLGNNATVITLLLGNNTAVNTLLLGNTQSLEDLVAGKLQEKCLFSEIQETYSGLGVVTLTFNGEDTSYSETFMFNYIAFMKAPLTR